MTDEELLKKYRRYKRKRNLIIMISFLFILMIGLFVYSRLSNKPVNDNKENIKEEIDITPPVLVLNKESIEINERDKIDYKSYIESATDEVDGDITNKVLYFEIDTSKIGEAEIIYYVLDNSNNMTQKSLKALIKEKPQETPENNPKEEQKESNNTNTTNNTKQPENKPKNDSKITKYFLFSDGYTMNNVVDACASELKRLNRAGRCIPLTDSAGIYLGMKLETN